MALNYDDNGNVDMETHKLIETTYNLLNLPFELNWLGQNRRINYYYTFEGEKLRKRVENNGILTKEDYCGPYVYETASGVRSLKYIVTPKGRAVRSGSNWTYEYHLADHLGNVRAVIRKGANGMAELIQQRHYYPFGMEISNMSSGTGTNKYLYNGKAIQNDFDLYWYDYGARFYDPQIGRWHTVDPLAEDYYSLSPYNYVANNPMIYIDPTGMALDNYSVDEQGNVKLEEETKDKFDMLYTKSDWKARNKDNGLKINDKSILPDLADNRTGYNGNYAISTNKDESFNVFSFMANNTNVEWGIDGYRTSGNNEYVIKTSHNPEGVTMSTTLSQYDEFDQIFSIHSHPGNATWEGTMGGSTGDQNNIINQYYRFKSAGMQGTNAWFKKDGSWTVLPKNYVYHEQSNTLYNYTPWKSSVFIRKINKANDMYRNLGF